MSVLETQYKEYLSKNPESKLTFEDWRKDVLMPIAKSIMENTEILIEMQKMTQQLLDKEESKK